MKSDRRWWNDGRIEREAEALRDTTTLHLGGDEPVLPEELPPGVVNMVWSRPGLLMRVTLPEFA